MLAYLVVFVSSILGAVVLTPVARRIALRIGAVDQPDGRRKLQKAPVPLWGGVAVYLALLIGLAVANAVIDSASASLVRLSWFLTATAGFVCFFGCLDDRLDLRPRFKLLLQIAATLPIVIGGYYFQRIVVFGYPIELGWFGILLTIFWLVGCINALNLLDGTDGLASVVGISSLTMIAFIAITSNSPHVAFAALALGGALAGFLIFNLPPASVYLGDSGSMLIGFVVGLLAIQGSMKASTTLSITIPVVIMTIPMLDTLMAVVRRKLSGARFDVGDRGHIHHRLLERGLSNWQVLSLVGILTLMTGAAAAASSVLRSDTLAWVIAIGIVVLLVRAKVFGHHEVAMIKLAFFGALKNGFRSLLIHRSRAAGELEPVRSFEDAWHLLVRQAGRWGLQCVELVSGPDPRHQYIWVNEFAPSKPSREWTISVSFSGPAKYPCRISIVGPESLTDHSGLLLPVSCALEEFIEQWSSMRFVLPRDDRPISLAFQRTREIEFGASIGSKAA